MIGTNMLEPECFDTDSSTSNFGIPNEETGSKLFAANFDPSGVIDQKGEHILLSGIETGGSIEAFRWSIESFRFIANHLQQVGVEDSRVWSRVEKKT